MRKAYDRILNDYVDAESASKNSNFELYRYQCPNCWEEVYMCAADSLNQASHFRHRNGNNNIECENYLGNRNTIIRNSLLYSNIRDKIGFYFLSSTKMFYISIKFSDDEISTYEQSGLSFQVMSSVTAKPSISIPINRCRFYPDVAELIPINEFSWEYYVYSLNSSKQHKYELFRKNNRGSLYPSFFKIQSDSTDNDFTAKLIQSDTLYTNIPYLVVFTHPYETLSSYSDVEVSKVIEFDTMGKDFVALVLIFAKKTPEIDQQLKLWELKLEINEELTLVWPPSTLVNESMVIGNDHAYLFSTFDLQAHGNINVNLDDIKYLGNGISKVSVSRRTNIYKKNVEIIIEKDKNTLYEYDDILVTQKESNKCVVSDNYTYLFNHSGIAQLGKGMTVFLTPYSEVRHYYSGYLNSIVSGEKDSYVLTGKRLLQDMLMYYKRVEVFNWDDYESVKLSHIASLYVEQCAKIGLINSAAKRFIKEGLI